MTSVKFSSTCGYTILSRFAAIRKNVQYAQQLDDNHNHNVLPQNKYLNEISLKLWLKKSDIISDKEFCYILAKEILHLLQLKRILLCRI